MPQQFINPLTNNQLRDINHQLRELNKLKLFLGTCAECGQDVNDLAANVTYLEDRLSKIKANFYRGNQ